MDLLGSYVSVGVGTFVTCPLSSSRLVSGYAHGRRFDEDNVHHAPLGFANRPPEAQLRIP